MADIPRPPFISYEQIHEKASEFLNAYHPTKTLPIPIEEIIDLKLRKHIQPHFKLEKNSGQTGYISIDLTTIVVDEDVYDYQENRFRFTLAHEIGHFILHADIYKTFAASCTPDEWKSIQLRQKGKDREWYDWQADSFAGLVLVPRDELRSHVAQCVQKIDENGISLKDNWDYAWSNVAHSLAREIFMVSAGTIESRLHYDKVKSSYELL